MAAPENSRKLSLFLDVPQTTAPGFVSGLIKGFSGQFERDYGPKSPLTSEVVKAHEGERMGELKGELERRGTQLYLSRRPYMRYRKTFTPEQVVVFVREPVARVVAQWEAARDGGHFTGSLLEFAEIPRNRNVQFRLLRGAPLRRLAFLGSSEDYAASLTRLRALNGFSKLPAELGKDALRAPQHQPTAAERAKLEELNSEDVALFQRARATMELVKNGGVGNARRTPEERETVRKQRRQRALEAAKRHTGPYAKGPLPLVSKEHRLALLFTPKAGCTFAVKWYLDQLGLLQDALEHSNWIHDYRQEVFYALEAYRPDDIALPGMRILKFARNPFDRAVSSYVHANRMGYEDAKVQAFLGRPVTADNRYSFREFVRYLGSVNLHTCNAHHQTQVHALEVSGLVKPTHLIRIEDSKRVIPQLERELDLKTTDLKALSSSRHHTERSADETFCGEVAFKLGRGNITMPSSKAFYDADLERDVASLYKDDFERYGYSTKLRT